MKTICARRIISTTNLYVYAADRDENVFDKNEKNSDYDQNSEYRQSLI